MSQVRVERHRQTERRWPVLPKRLTARAEGRRAEPVDKGQRGGRPPRKEPAERGRQNADRERRQNRGGDLLARPKPRSVWIGRGEDGVNEERRRQDRRAHGVT